MIVGFTTSSYARSPLLAKKQKFQEKHFFPQEEFGTYSMEEFLSFINIIMGLA
jgi:hypothetical protein